MPDVISEATTMLDALEQALQRAASYNEHSRVAPAALLWTDAKREWTRLLPRLREAFPQLLTLGDYAPDARTGPAIWIKCMLARALPGADWPDEATPIVYLPGISRRDLRAVESCPPALQPLAELQYRGTFFTQTNARDWTVRAFLMSEDGGLGLEVARDDATQQALQRALTALADTPLELLRGRHLDADAFRGLVAKDPVRDVLRWLSDPDRMREQWGDDRWATFCELCRDTYGFDPEKDGPLSAARRLGQKEGVWTTVWQRYLEAPRRYPGVEAQLRQARPPRTGDLFAREPTWPQDNEASEDELRNALLKLEDLRVDQAAKRIEALEDEHGERRAWVWADVGHTPLADALEHLHALAQAAQSPVGGSTPDDVAASYRAHGWQADAAVLRALRAVRESADVEAVHTAVHALYRTWLERGAEALQEAISQHGAPAAPGPVPMSKGDVLLFVDALRYDVGQQLADALRYEAYEVDGGWRWAALPTVTPTAKPALAPIATALSPDSPPDEFRPRLGEDGPALSIRHFRQWMEDHGHQILGGGETGDPSGTAWAEIGAIDQYGHHEEWKLARRIGELLREVVQRVRQLLGAGWSRVQVVTDHGWLLVPGALPKEDLPHYLTETRWGRCATLKAGAATDRIVVPWRWNPDVRIAMASGIHVHRRGLGYAHGGLSVQECVVPHLIVTSGEPAREAARIEQVAWSRLRCRVQVTPARSGLQVDLRTRAGDPDTSVALRPKRIGADGAASLPVPDPQREGEAVAVVLLGEDGEVVHTYPTTIGGGDA